MVSVSKQSVFLEFSWHDMFLLVTIFKFTLGQGVPEDNASSQILTVHFIGKISFKKTFWRLLNHPILRGYHEQFTILIQLVFYPP